jgi:hypothetical protein
MSKAYSFLIRIPCNVYNLASAEFGLNGGVSAVTSVSTASININDAISGYFPYCKVKLVEGATVEYKVIKTITAITGGYTLTFTSNIITSFTTAAECYIESYFGFVYNSTTSVSTTKGYFYADLLTDFSGVSRSFVDSCERGGSVQADEGGNFSIVNTGKLSLYCESNNIFLHNCAVNIFLKVNTDVSTYTLSDLGKYIVSDVSWSVEKLNINFSGTNTKRTTYITSKLNTQDYPNVNSDMIGETIPICFGRNYLNSQFAKFIRSNSLDEPFQLWNNTYDSFISPTPVTIDLSVVGDANFVTYNTISSRLNEGYYSLFPCVGAAATAPNTTFYFQLAITGVVYVNGSPVTTGQIATSLLVGKYIHSMQGLTEDVYRKIKTAYIDLDIHTSGGIITLEVEDYYEQIEPVGNATATAADNTWIEIVDLEKEYIGDTWKCKEFLTTAGTATTEITGYVYNENKNIDIEVSGAAENITSAVKTAAKNFSSLPQAMLSAKDSNNNSLRSNFTYLTDEDSTDSFLIVPFKSYNLATLSPTDLNTKYGISGYNYAAAGGLYSSIDVYDVDSLNYNPDPNNYVFSMNYKTRNWASSVQKTAVFQEFQIPDMSKFDGYSAAYLYLESSFFCTIAAGGLDVNYGNGTNYTLLVSNFMGTAYTKTLRSKATWQNTLRYSDSLNALTIGSQDFFVNTDTTGYYNFDISEYVLSKSKRPKYNNFALSFGTEHYKTTSADLIQNWTYFCNKLALVLKKSVSIEKKIFTPFAGRIFNDTWTTFSDRKTATDLIESPIDILEHTCRLQNFSEINENISLGKEYFPDAAVSTSPSVYGSFDTFTDDRVFDLRNTTTAFSLSDYEKCNTGWLKSTLCKNYFLASYTNLSGEESVIGLTREAQSPSISFSLADISDRTKIVIEEPNIQNIYCEPTIKYNWSPALDKFASEISITNTSKDTYQDGYVKGVTSSTDASILWALGRSLYLKSKNIEQAPTDMTDLYTVGGVEGYDLAVDYLYNLLIWQFNKRLNISLHIDKLISNNLDIGSRISIRLPHHTDDVYIEGTIVKIKIKPEIPYICDVKLVLYSLPYEDFVIQDTYDTSAEEWQDTYTEFGNDNDINNI